MLPTTMSRGPRPKMPVRFGLDLVEEDASSTGVNDPEEAAKEPSFSSAVSRAAAVAAFFAFLDKGAVEEVVSVEEVGAELVERRVSMTDSVKAAFSGSGV